MGMSLGNGSVSKAHSQNRESYKKSVHILQQTYQRADSWMNAFAWLATALIIKTCYLKTRCKLFQQIVTLKIGNLEQAFLVVHINSFA